MARQKPSEAIATREPKPEPPSEATAKPRIGPGWTITIALWLVLFTALLVYEAWGFFGGIFRLR